MKLHRPKSRASTMSEWPWPCWLNHFKMVVGENDLDFTRLWARHWRLAAMAKIIPSTGLYKSRPSPLETVFWICSEPRYLNITAYSARCLSKSKILYIQELKQDWTQYAAIFKFQDKCHDRLVLIFQNRASREYKELFNVWYERRGILAINFSSVLLVAVFQVYHPESHVSALSPYPNNHADPLERSLNTYFYQSRNPE